MTPARDEVQQRRDPGVRVLGSTAGQEREQAGQEEARARTRSRSASSTKQERGPEAQPAGRPDGAGQVPRAVEQLVPAAGRRRAPRSRRRCRRTACRSPRPAGRRGAAPPLVEQRQREDQREDRGERGQPDALPASSRFSGRASGARSTRVRVQDLGRSTSVRRPTEERTRGRRDGCRRRGPTASESPGPGSGIGRMISRTSDLRQNQ